MVLSVETVDCMLSNAVLCSVDAISFQKSKMLCMHSRLWRMLRTSRQSSSRDPAASGLLIGVWIMLQTAKSASATPSVFAACMWQQYTNISALMLTQAAVALLQMAGRVTTTPATRPAANNDPELSLIQSAILCCRRPAGQQRRPQRTQQRAGRRCEKTSESHVFGSLRRAASQDLPSVPPSL